MARIQGVDLPNDKRIVIALQYIYGIGTSKSKKILETVGIDQNVKARDLTEDEVNRLAGEIENNHTVEGQLRRQIAQNIQRLKDINCFRGVRHKKGLPVRGQRTRTNARTRKGPRRTVAVKKSVKAAK